MNNLVNEEAFSEIKAKLDRKLLQELERIGEISIETRDHYLKKFGYFGKKEFRKDYHIKNVGDVKVVISPNDSFTIK